MTGFVAEAPNVNAEVTVAAPAAERSATGATAAVDVVVVAATGAPEAGVADPVAEPEEAILSAAPTPEPKANTCRGVAATGAAADGAAAVPPVSTLEEGAVLGATTGAALGAGAGIDSVPSVIADPPNWNLTVDLLVGLADITRHKTSGDESEFAQHHG